MGLSEGDVVSDFSCSLDDGSTLNFYDALDKTSKGIILFAYPKASTPGCTQQACLLRDAKSQLEKNGYEIYGMSKDNQTAQTKFKTKNELPYPLLCEAENVLKLFGCLLSNSVTRSVFIIDKETKKLAHSHIKVSPKDCLQLVIEAVGSDASPEEKEEKVLPEEKSKNKRTAASKKPPKLPALKAAKPENAPSSQRESAKKKEEPIAPPAKSARAASRGREPSKRVGSETRRAPAKRGASKKSSEEGAGAEKKVQKRSGSGTKSRSPKGERTEKPPSARSARKAVAKPSAPSMSGVKQSSTQKAREGVPSSDSRSDGSGAKSVQKKRGAGGTTKVPTKKAIKITKN